MAAKRTSRRRTQLRAQAIAHSLFEPRGLGEAVAWLGFVQADPIRAPARAQDLILRPRVTGYRVGDLDLAYADLGLEEAMLYAYGFMTRETWSCLHPRRHPRPLSKLERRVLALVPSLAPVHPRDLDAHFGRRRERNGWGGHSQATKLALEVLHRRGLLRVAGRKQGIRLYEPAPPVPEVAARERLLRLARLVARVFAPAPKPTVRAILARLGRALLDPQAGPQALEQLIRGDELREEAVDGVPYLVPVDAPPPRDPPERVRILAPFDPLVHDRRRFEHLWGWAYRFEAYTPVAQRVRGYYAMPLLWRDRMVGWVNVSAKESGVEPEVGYVTSRPREAAFRRELEAELERFASFLQPRASE
ncbi:MAG: YcaQ family DNA glycosylase [Planctomycetes bacterium]|nr:YcaQ family DNA glycosylase [Planctomycetota bacterium]